MHAIIVFMHTPLPKPLPGFPWENLLTIEELEKRNALTGGAKTQIGRGVWQPGSSVFSNRYSVFGGGRAAAAKSPTTLGAWHPL